MHVCETKNMDLLNKVHNFEPMEVHTFEPKIRLIRLFSLMLNYAKPPISNQSIINWLATDSRQLKWLFGRESNRNSTP